ncbi:MAG: major capsid protein [Magnetococcales bacterium]|nr:major capsid protein [Magnetococcales bacterium]
MPMMNLAQVRLVDPVLTEISLGYRNAALVGEVLFPRVPVSLRAGKIIEFDKQAFLLVNTARAPGSGVKEINIGYEGAPFALDAHSLAGKIPQEHMEEAARGPGVDLGSRAVTTVMDIMLLGAEHEQAVLARNEARYPAGHVLDLNSAGQTQWTNGVSDPMRDIDTGREVVRAAIGRYPNTLLLGPKAFNAAKTHPDVIDKIKYTTSASVTVEMLAAQWNLKRVVVGEAVYTDDTGQTHDVWGADAILAYVPDGGVGREVPSYGYTYVLQGNPFVETPYYDAKIKSWLHPVTYERKPVMVGPGAGFLIQNAG